MDTLKMVPGVPVDASISDGNGVAENSKGTQPKLEATVDSLLTFGAKFFTDTVGTPMGFIKVDEHFESWPLKSKKFRGCLRRLFRDNFLIKAARLKRLLQELEYEAEMEEIEVYNRFAFRDNKVLIDLSDSTWQHVEVDSDGWNLRKHDRPLFIRQKHQKPLPVPVPGGDALDLFKHISAKNDAEQLLILAWTLSAMHPTIATPMLLLVGPPASRKSTTGQRLRSMLDPSSICELGEFDRRALPQIAHHHALPMFDNLSGLRRKEADFFCRLVTGGGIERRRLFSDSDAFIMSYRRACIFNGIDLPSTRPDFLDRCIVVRFNRVSEFAERPNLEEQFEAERAKIFGGLLDLLCRTLHIFTSTPATGDFRLAELARFGRAVAAALGRDINEFDLAYHTAIKEHHYEIIEDSAVATSLLRFVAKTEMPWEGTAGELLRQLKNCASETAAAVGARSWPGSPRWVSSQLSELIPVMKEHGVSIKRMDRSSRKRPSVP